MAHWSLEVRAPWYWIIWPSQVGPQSYGYFNEQICAFDSLHGRWESIRECLQCFFTSRWTQDNTFALWHARWFHHPYGSKVKQRQFSHQEDLFVRQFFKCNCRRSVCFKSPLQTLWRRLPSSKSLMDTATPVALLRWWTMKQSDREDDVCQANWIWRSFVLNCNAKRDYNCFSRFY